jgi:hypothetical protein
MLEKHFELCDSIWNVTKSPRVQFRVFVRVCDPKNTKMLILGRTVCHSAWAAIILVMHDSYSSAVALNKGKYAG